MKRAFFLVLLVVALLLELTSCGGSNSSSSQTTQAQTSGITKRAFVSNQYGGVLDIINAANDSVSQTVSSTTSIINSPIHTISTGTSPTLMAESPDKSKTLVFDQASNHVLVITNSQEAAAGQVLLPNFTESMVAGTDNKTGYAAVRNAAVSGQPSGAVEVLDLSAFNISATIPVPAARRIVLSHNGGKLLAFGDGSDQVAVIDTASKAVTMVAGFDRPVWGVFSSDDTVAYILSCGQECGGTTAKVNALTIASGAVGSDVPVSAATVGLLDSGNLYVAGTAAGAGKLDVIGTGSMTVSKSGVAITDGYHQLMALSNGKLFIGARTCSNAVNGCLTIYNVSAGTATLSQPHGDVTGLQPIDGRTVVYVVEGGELRIYDTSTDAPTTGQIDIIGKAVDVKLVD